MQWELRGAITFQRKTKQNKTKDVLSEIEISKTKQAKTKTKNAKRNPKQTKPWNGTLGFLPNAEIPVSPSHL